MLLWWYAIQLYGIWIQANISGDIVDDNDANADANDDDHDTQLGVKCLQN